MTETPQSPQKKGRTASRKRQGTPASPASPRVSQRAVRKSQREEQTKRLVTRYVAGGIALAVLAVVIGLLYDQVWVPSRALAQVNNETLTRRAYWQEARDSMVGELVQSFQILKLFGNNEQIASQYRGQSIVVNQQLDALSSLPENEQVIQQWQDRQVLIQGAAAMNLTASPDEINQQVVANLGFSFLPPADVPTSAITPTAVLTPSGEMTNTDTTSERSNTTAVPSARETPATAPTDNTPSAIATVLAPTDTPLPTPVPDVAREQVTQIAGALFVLYETELTELTKGEMKSILTRDDFAHALQEQALQSVLMRKVREQLVPEATFEASSEPGRVQARHILLKVDVPITATQEVKDAAFAAVLPEAQQVVGQLRKGADFATLVTTYSDDPGSKEQGGDVGFFDTDGRTDTDTMYDPDFVKAAFALDVNEISDPVRTQFGWHIIQVTDEEVLSKEEQLRQAQDKAYQTWFEEQKKAATMKRFPEPEESPTPTLEPEPTLEPTIVPGPPTPFPGMPTPPVETAPISETLPISETVPISETEPISETMPISETEPISETVPISGTDALSQTRANRGE